MGARTPPSRLPAAALHSTERPRRSAQAAERTATRAPQRRHACAAAPQLCCRYIARCAGRQCRRAGHAGKPKAQFAYVFRPCPTPCAAQLCTGPPPLLAETGVARYVTPSGPSYPPSVPLVRNCPPHGYRRLTACAPTPSSLKSLPVANRSLCTLTTRTPQPTSRESARTAQTRISVGQHALKGSPGYLLPPSSGTTLNYLFPSRQAQQTVQRARLRVLCAAGAPRAPPAAGVQPLGRARSAAAPASSQRLTPQPRPPGTLQSPCISAHQPQAYPHNAPAQGRTWRAEERMCMSPSRAESVLRPPAPAQGRTPEHA